MYVIKHVNMNGKKAVYECRTLTEAKIYCDDFAEGRKECDDNDDQVPWCRLEVYEVLPDGNEECVHTTGCYIEEE